MQEALELVCRKRKLPNPKDYALLLGDMSLLIPLDRTVASLQGKRELVLIKRTMLPQLGIDVLKGTQKTTDPNGSAYFDVMDSTHYVSSINFQAHVRSPRNPIVCVGLHRSLQGNSLPHP
jgi:hypothetical protein